MMTWSLWDVGLDLIQIKVTNIHGYVEGQDQGLQCALDLWKYDNFLGSVNKLYLLGESV